MDGVERSGDARTFKVSFTGDGAARLRERVKEKLKEFMGDYTDDTLVEYVVVLLRNGRRKDEARRELNVFLGDDSDSFVSWLWDHLSADLHLYVQPKESSPDEVARTKPVLIESSGRHLQGEHVIGDVPANSDYGRDKNKASRSRHNRDWKELVQEHIRSFSPQKTYPEEKTHQRPSIVRRSSSPRPQLRKRNREGEQPPIKRDPAVIPVIDAPRRLLQFAVRDAFRTVQQSTSRTEPALKRLRSVVSTSTTDSMLDERLRMRSVGRLPGAFATALKAAAEAAEDVSKVSKYSGSVFDRLGHGTMVPDAVNQNLDFKEPMSEYEEYEDFDQIPVADHSDFHERSNYDGGLIGDVTMLGRDNEITTESASYNEAYGDVHVSRHQDYAVSQSASSANRDKKPLMVKYSVAQNADETTRNTRPLEGLPASAATKGSSKIVNISVNVNTWKPPHYQEPRDVTGVEDQMAVDKNEASAAKPNVHLLKDNTAKSENKNAMASKDIQKESQKTGALVPGSYATGFPSMDVDSRTVFVSNVHFAATKDNLSRHFNKFGEVLKVIIMTDAATGQPTGSAYVEFLRKESAELALSLNGTSFMSRILKVVSRSNARPEAAATMGWPRIARASPFAARLSRVPYPRGVLASAFRGRIPIKTGARSLQWKREASTEKGSQRPATPGNSVLSPSGRNLTYVRPEPKAV